jgi:16S rRNA (guanine966-N2)-methyltransferase
MKDRVREAVFNLIGDRVAGRHAVDLFAGTGALGLEALSRGAGGATFVERHFPTARVIEQNIATLAVQGLARVVTGDTFRWAAGAPQLPAAPWLVFCAPPYEYFHSRTAEMIALVQTFLERAPGGSLLVVEADTAFDFNQLPDAHGWRVRPYPPAVIGICPLPDARDGPAVVTSLNG